MHRALLTLVVLGAAIPASNVSAEWAPDGAAIHSIISTSTVPQVAACSDGAQGFFVAWQEVPVTGEGILRFQHVLASGDVDPAWPAAGAVACSVGISRYSVGALADGLGGSYLWWVEDPGRSFYVTRVGPDGQIMPGWPARGRLLGPTEPLGFVQQSPSLAVGTSHDLYAVWIHPSSLVVRAIHLAPDNTGAGGWPDAPLTISPNPPSTEDFWPQIVLASDGGAFIAWALRSRNASLQSTCRLARITPAGQPAEGWPAGGVDVVTMEVPNSSSSRIALAGDGRSGVFLLTEEQIIPGYVQSRLRRIQEDGLPAPGWSPEGSSVGPATSMWRDVGTDGTVDLLEDGAEGALVGTTSFYSEDTSVMSYLSTESGWIHNGPMAYAIPGFERVSNGRGGLYVASYFPHGPWSQYEPPAYLSVTQGPVPSGWSDWLEAHPEPAAPWFGDIALVATGDGGAVLFWSQQVERFGIFARRFGPGGQVTGVEDAVTDRRSALGAPRPNPLRVAASASISIHLGHEDEVRLAVHDIAGREVARRDPERFAAGSHVLTWKPDVRVPGVYFLTMRSSRGVAASRRWVVMR